MNKTGPQQSARGALAVERAKLTIWQLHEFGFRPYLDVQGALLIADATGDRSGLSRYLPIAKVFADLVAGLADDPGLLDPPEARETKGGSIIFDAPDLSLPETVSEVRTAYDRERNRELLDLVEE